MTNRLLINVLLLCVATPALAFDGKRKGFVIGSAAGLFTAAAERRKPSDPTQANGDFTAWGTQDALFKIGYGFSDFVAVTQNREISTLGLLNGPIISVWTRRTAPCVVLSAGFGYAVWADTLDAIGYLDDEKSALAPIIRLGYEWGSHWFVEAQVAPANPTGRWQDREFKTKIIDVSIPVGYLAY